MQEITIPYKFDPRPYQVEFLSAPQRFKIAVWHRRGGKSKTVLNQQIQRLHATPGLYYYFLPTFRQAKAVIWDSLIKAHVPMELVERVNSSELTVYWKNGSIQKFVGCDNINSHRGINPIDVVFDEYSEMDEEIWTAIVQPVLAENGGTATFIFTPKGKNHSYRLTTQARDQADWFVSVKGVADTNGIDEEELAKVKQNTPEALYEQEYNVAFQENAGAFFRRIRSNLYNPHSSALYTTPQRHHTYQLGIDLAKYNDWTVITPFDLTNFHVLPQDRFNQVDWNLQKARIQVASMKYNSPQVMIDRTGVGDSIVDDLESQGVEIGEEGSILFTNKTKMNLLRNLAILLEQDKIKIPNDPGLIDELEAFQYSMTEKGTIKAEAPKGEHDDRVISLALAVWNIPEKPLGETPITTTNNYLQSESNSHSVFSEEYPHSDPTSLFEAI